MPEGQRKQSLFFVRVRFLRFLRRRVRAFAVGEELRGEFVDGAQRPPHEHHRARVVHHRFKTRGGVQQDELQTTAAGVAIRRSDGAFRRNVFLDEHAAVGVGGGERGDERRHRVHRPYPRRFLPVPGVRSDDGGDAQVDVAEFAVFPVPPRRGLVRAFPRLVVLARRNARRGAARVLAVPRDLVRDLALFQVLGQREHVHGVRAGVEQEIVQGFYRRDFRRDFRLETVEALFERRAQRLERLEVPQVPRREPRVEPLGVRFDHAEHGVELRAGDARAVRAVHGLGEVVRLVEHHHRVFQSYAQRVARLRVQKRRVRREDEISARVRRARRVIRTRPALHARARQILDVHRGRQSLLRELCDRAAALAKERTPFFFFLFRLVFRDVASAASVASVARRLLLRAPARLPSRLPALLGELEAPLVEPRRGRARGLERVAVDAQLAPAGDGHRRHEPPVLLAARRAGDATERGRPQLAHHLRQLRVRAAAEDDLRRWEIVLVRVGNVHANELFCVCSCAGTNALEPRLNRVGLGNEIRLFVRRRVVAANRARRRPGLVRPVIRQELSLLDGVVPGRAAGHRRGVRRHSRRLRGGFAAARNGARIGARFGFT